MLSAAAGAEIEKRGSNVSSAFKQKHSWALPASHPYLLFRTWRQCHSPAPCWPEMAQGVSYHPVFRSPGLYCELQKVCLLLVWRQTVVGCRANVAWTSSLLATYAGRDAAQAHIHKKGEEVCCKGRWSLPLMEGW